MKKFFSSNLPKRNNMNIVLPEQKQIHFFLFAGRVFIPKCLIL